MSSTKILAVTTTLLALALPATAQYVSTTSRTAGYAKSYGSSMARGRVDLRAAVSRQKATLRGRTANRLAASGGLRARVSLFGRSLDALSFDASGYARDGCWTTRYGRVASITASRRAHATLTLRIVGVTVWSRSAGTTASLSFTRGMQYRVFPRDPSTTVTVGPIPVTVSGNAAVSANLGVRAILDPLNLRCGLSGTARGWASGWARAGIGVRGFSFGVKTTLRFADTTATFEHSAGLGTLSGRLAWSLVPITLKLEAYAKAWWATYRYTLFRWSMRGVRGSRNLY